MDVLQLLEKRKIAYVSTSQDYKVCCLSPDHEDSNPSMHIDKITGIFNCLSCGFKGNIFHFFEEQINFLQMKKVLFKRKLEQKLAENIGLEMPKGFIPFNKEWRSISAQTYKDFEAFEHHDPSFIGRLVFPIRGVSGKILGFNARAQSPEVSPKYLISPPDSVFPLFPARVAPKQGRIILVEGIFDMLNLYDKGLTNTVCAFGTQKLTREKLILLKVQGVTGIDILFDGDDAGVAATQKAVELIESLEIATKTVHLKSGDPGVMTASQVLKLKEALYG